MAKENLQQSSCPFDEPRTQLVDNFKEHNDWVDARESANCIYDEAAYQRIEASFPYDNTVDNARVRQEILEMGAALIVDRWQRDGVANNDPERDELDVIRSNLAAALDRLETYEVSLGGAGQRLAHAVRESSAPRPKLPALVSSVRILRDLCASAIEGIPNSKSGPSPLARPGVERLARFWHRRTGRSVLTENHVTHETSFELFEKFAAAVIEPLQLAGHNVPIPTHHEVRTVLTAK